MTSTTDWMLDQLEIQQVISRYHEAASTGDWDALFATFLPRRGVGGALTGDPL